MQTSPAQSYSGERFDPTKANALAHYDHHARYTFVARSFGGGRLLDVGCGLGVGAQVLSASFESVLGIDASAGAIEQATADRARTGLQFQTVEAFLREPGAGFDVVTCLEVIEHTTEQRQLLELLRAAVGPTGVVVVSTPNRAWTERRKIVNPYHVRELTRAEFTSLVESVFPYVQHYSQLQVEGACIVPEVPPPSLHTTFTRPVQPPTPFVAADVTNFVAVCSLGPRAAAPTSVTVLDPGCTYQAELEGVIASNERMIDERVALIGQQDALVSALKAQLAETNQRIEALEALSSRAASEGAAPPPLRYRLADRANDALKRTPLHALLKKASSRLNGGGDD